MNRLKVFLLLLLPLLVGLAFGLWLWQQPQRAERPSPEQQAALIALATSAGDGSPWVLREPVMKRVEFQASWTNPGPGRIEDLHIYIGVPPNLPEQELLELRWSREPDRYLEDRYGQRLADFAFGELEPGRTVTLGLTVLGRFGKIAYSIDPSRVGGLEEVPEEVRSLYTADGPYYRISDPLIISTAREVVGEERNPYLMALRIHDFVARRLSYDLDGEWDDAPTVLRRRSGSCSEFTFLFIALARAVGLPARYAGGSVYIPRGAFNGTFVDRYNHRWVEVYLPGYGWVPFDPTWDDGSQEYAGSHGHALIFNQGDLDPRYLGVSYIAAAQGDGATPVRGEWVTVWSGP
ncbi:MAG: transglutaminase-like domain-containing protein [Candidatus Bipolaricaulia bacterium]